jgi:hypothetical protein
MIRSQRAGQAGTAPRPEALDCFSGSVQESVRAPNFSGVGRCRCQQPAVVVAVEMWEPAFGAGFQARWDGQQSSAKIPL